MNEYSTITHDSFTLSNSDQLLSPPDSFSWPGTARLPSLGYSHLAPWGSARAAADDRSATTCMSLYCSMTSARPSPACCATSSTPEVTPPPPPRALGLCVDALPLSVTLCRNWKKKKKKTSSPFPSRLPSPFKATRGCRQPPAFPGARSLRLSAPPWPSFCLALFRCRPFLCVSAASPSQRPHARRGAVHGSRDALRVLLGQICT